MLNPASVRQVYRHYNDICPQDSFYFKSPGYAYKRE